jgi:hypothetical protein
MEATTIQSLFDAKTGYSEEKHVNQQRKIMIENIVQDKSSHTRHVLYHYLYTTC